MSVILKVLIISLVIVLFMFAFGFILVKLTKFNEYDANSLLNDKDEETDIENEEVGEKENND